MKACTVHSVFKIEIIVSDYLSLATKIAQVIRKNKAIQRNAMIEEVS